MSATDQPTNEPETSSLIERAQQGDQAALEQVFTRYREPLHFFIRAMLGPNLRTKLDSEDIVQSTLMDTFNALPGFKDNGPGSFWKYLKPRALHKIADKHDHHFAQKRTPPNREVSIDALDRPVDAIDRTAKTPSELVAEDEMRQRLMQAIDRLREQSPEAAKLVVLSKLGGLTNAEIARLTNRPTPDAARKAIERSLAKLAEIAMQLGIDQ